MRQDLANTTQEHLRNISTESEKVCSNSKTSVKLFSEGVKQDTSDLLKLATEMHMKIRKEVSSNSDDYHQWRKSMDSALFEL